MVDTSRSRAVKDYRKRLRDRGLVRFEVQGLEGDRELIRALARRLAEGAPEASRVRAALMRSIEERRPSVGGIYAALRRSPLVGADINMSRTRDPDRDVDF